MSLHLAALHSMHQNDGARESNTAVLEYLPLVTQHMLGHHAHAQGFCHPPAAASAGWAIKKR